MVHCLRVSLRGSLPYMRQEWERKSGRERVGGGGEYLGQIVEHADPLCRHTHVRVLSLSADKTTCMFIDSRDRGL